jgi:HEAT repeat protein
MAIKVFESFIRFVTMGAAGAHRAVEVLNRQGHDARELERYATCNKIWQRKIKRLRMPDLFCLHCGGRFEVRAKSKLEIKMSDSPDVAGREWDAGLRDRDVVLFVRSEAGDDGPIIAGSVEAFEVGALRASVASSKLGDAKSAGEGAERDRTWPAVVPSSSGVVQEVGGDRISVQLETGRKQTYRLVKPKTGAILAPYLAPRERFVGPEQFIAGAPRQKAELRCAGSVWDPKNDFRSDDPMTRFAAVKAAGLLGMEGTRPELWRVSQEDSDPRVKLESLGALLRLNDQAAQAKLLEFFDQPTGDDLRMEAVLLSGEVRTSAAHECLIAMLGRPVSAQDEELRAAIVWCLGTYGHRDLEAVVDYLGDPSDLVASHAAVAMGSPLAPDLRQRLIALLTGESARAAASAAWVLQRDSSDVLPLLIELAQRDAIGRGWAISILGRRSSEEVLPLLGDKPELQRLLEPWWIVAPSQNWAFTPAGLVVLEEVSKQTLVQTI